MTTTLRTPARSKVPEITALFWVIKVLTTGMGETASDYLGNNLPIALAGIIGLGAFVAALVLQFRARQYVAWIYWTAVVMVSVFGTMAADVLHAGIGISYWVSTPFFLVVLLAIFALWRRSEGTLSIHSVITRRRETFYWATVLATFALGTAAGDLTATKLGWGYLGSGVVFAVAIAVPALAFRLRWLGDVAAFWIAYVITRPLGASFADWMADAKDRGGLALGTGPTTLLWLAAIVVLVAYLAIAPSRASGDMPAQEMADV